MDSPITRFRKYLESRSIWDEQKEQTFKKQVRLDLLKAFSTAEKKNKPSINEMFTDVYGGNEMPWNIKEQVCLISLFPFYK